MQEDDRSNRPTDGRVGSSDPRMVKLLQNALSKQNEAMVPVQALYDIAGEDWLIAANEAGLEVNARVERPDRASQFALVVRRPPVSPRPT
jgi:hypothetical protein